MKKFLILMSVGLLSCGPSKEEIEKTNALVKPLYNIGNVVYLKPDSCSALITGTETITDYNKNSSVVYTAYTIKNSRGEYGRVIDGFIYGLKHK